MGQESIVELRLNGASHQVKAHLDSVAVTLRGRVSLTLKVADVQSAETTRDGWLKLATVRGETWELGLGAKAAAMWADKIRHPRSLIDKLGFKTDSRVCVLGVEDLEFWRQALERLIAPPERTPADGLDFVIFAADTLSQLSALGDLKGRLRSNGAIWVVSPKGRTARIKDTDVIHAGKAAGLVDNKVCSFSETHTALKFVIPRGAR